MVAHNCDHNIQDTEAGGSGGQGSSWLHNKLKTILGYMRPCLQRHSKAKNVCPNILHILAFLYGTLYRHGHPYFIYKETEVQRSLITLYTNGRNGFLTHFLFLITYEVFILLEIKGFI